MQEVTKKVAHEKKINLLELPYSAQEALMRGSILILFFVLIFTKAMV
jgi:hypothetical protein